MIQVGCVRAESASATQPTSLPWSPTFKSSSRRSCSRCPGSSRKSSTRRRTALESTAREPSSTGPPTPRSTTAAASPTETRARFDALGTRCTSEASTAGPRSFGGSCTTAVSGGAPLGERLGHFYRGVGVTVLEGYGLTEIHRRAHREPSHAIRMGPWGSRSAGTDSPGRRRRRGSGARRPGHARVLARPQSHRPGSGCTRVGYTPAISERSTTKASSASPAARRRCS